MTQARMIAAGDKVPESKRHWAWPRHADPVSMASMWVPYGIYPWQRAVLNDLTPGSQVALVTPNESGKTSTVIPVAGLSFLAAHPGAKVVSTSGAERQIKDQLWPNLRAALAKYPAWEILEELVVKAPSVAGMPPATWKAFSTNDPALAEGFHGQLYEDETGRERYAPLMVIIDEAKSINQAMFDAFIRCGPDVWLIASTPGEDTGPFYHAFNQNRSDWRCHEIGWNDCPHLRSGVQLEKRLKLIEQRGEDDPFVMSFVFGKFFRGAGTPLFPSMTDVDACMSGLVKWARGARRSAVDFSGGGDEQVCMIRDGNMVLEISAYREKDTTVLGDKLIKLWRKWEVKAEDVTADNGGLGKPIIDYLERQGWRGIRRYMGNEPARDGANFFNKSSEDHFYLRELVTQRCFSCPRDEVLREQMNKRWYVRPNDDNNRIRTEPKPKHRDRCGSSPDRLDTLVMLFCDMPFPQQQGPLGVRNPASRCGDAQDWFDTRREQEGATELWAESYF